MTRRARLTLVSALMLLTIALTSAPASAQVDLSGMWQAYLHEDFPYRGPGPMIGDYIGMPINDEARARADSWDARLMAKPEHQCIMYSQYYLVMQPFGIQVLPEADAITGKINVWHISGTIDRTPQHIYMDGRPHPSKNSIHTSSGFSTGEWQGNTLVVYVTHLTEGIIWRSGVPHSDLATITEFINRHGNTLTITMMLDDPVYLESTMVRTVTYVLEPSMGFFYNNTCQPQVEIDQDPDAVPNYLPGKNAFLKEPSDHFHILPEAFRGGAATEYPEYTKKLKTYVPPPATKK
jgi:hypothetical protein